MSDDNLSQRERDRIRRRDRDAEAQAREPMRPGMGKVFKQIQDSQARKAAGTRKKGPEGEADR
jgi:hypothetical protein